MKKLYGGIKMTWLRVAIFAIAAGAYTGFVMTLPFLHDTSFQDIGVTYEWWVIFAVIVVVNCKKGLEAMLKCFLFFLISQPLVYLVEIALGSLAMEDGLRYYLNIWLPMTMLTLPGGLIAYFCKKQNVLGACILGLGNTIQAVMALAYFVTAAERFPRHLLTALVCVGSIFVMSLSIQKKRANRIIAIALPVLLTAVILILLRLTGRVLVS